MAELTDFEKEVVTYIARHSGGVVIMDAYYYPLLADLFSTRGFDWIQSSAAPRRSAEVKIK